MRNLISVLSFALIHSATVLYTQSYTEYCPATPEFSHLDALHQNGNIYYAYTDNFYIYKIYSSGEELQLYKGEISESPIKSTSQNECKKYTGLVRIAHGAQANRYF